MQNSQVIEGYQLSVRQGRLWGPSQSGGAFAAQSALLLEGALDAAALRRAARLLAGRHEILRTTFRRLPGMSLPLQVPAAAGDSPSWEEGELGDLGAGDLLEAVDARMREERGRAFDFERGPLWRCSLLRLTASRSVLLMTLPALCADARTLKNMTAELAGLYAEVAAGAAGGEDPAGAAGSNGSGGGEPAGDDEGSGPIQFVHFSEWERELLEDGNAARAFWLRPEYAGRPALALPHEAAPDDEAGCPRLERVPVEVGADLVARFEAEARRRGKSPAAAWLAAWVTTLWRLTGETGCVVDYVCDGRKYEELGGGLGLFERPVPARCHFDGDLQFEEVLAQAADAIELAEQWQEYAAGGEEDGGGSGAADEADRVAFEYGQGQPAAARAAGVTFSPLREYCCTSPFKLKLSCVERGDSLACELQYDANRITAESAGRLAGYVATVVAGACEAPQAPARGLPLLPAAERRRLLYELNDTRRDYDTGSLAHELFEAQAAATPDAPAVVFRGLSLSYSELNERADRLARHLLSLGAGPEARVGLLLERSADLLVALLAALKAGAAYVPLDHTHPKERLGFLLADAGVSVLLFHERLRAQVPEHGARPVCLDGLDLGAEGDANPSPRADARNAAYVIYTSGSTGQPKGVVVEHRSLVNYVRGVCERLGVRPGMSYALVQPLTVDFGVTALFPSLVTGGCLHVVPEELLTDADGLAGYFAGHGIDFLKIAPSHLTALLAGPEPARLLPRSLLVLGGEVAQPTLVEQARTLSPGCSVHSHYGPTETTVGVLTSRAGDDAGVDGAQALPAGRPLPNSAVYLLDAGLEPVPAGCAGELYVGGAGLARGYLGRPGLTAERFVPDPFSAEPGARLYRTGDLARHLPDGRVEYLGRADQQVKVRGFRVEPGEIEAALRLHPSVKSAAVAAREEASGEKRLIAYVVLAQKGTPFAELRAFLRERLPDYMIPAAFVRLDAMPLTRSGKVDKLSLPAPDPSGLDPESPFVPPATLEEEVLANIWADVLAVERVGADDNFFALGGDSMRSIQVLIKARQRGLDLGHDQLFQHQTVRELAAAVAAAQGGGLVRARTEPFGLVSDEDRAKMPEGVEDAYPLARIQAGMIYHSEYSPDSAIYHDLHTYHLQFHFDRRAMQAALDQVIARHPLLRTSFDLTRFSQPLQLVHERVEVPLAVEDLSGLTAAEQDEAVSAWIDAEKRRRVDWRRPPLLRFQVHVRSEGTLQFSVSYHHALLDGWSSASMQTELFQRYLTLLRAPEAVPPAAPLSITYRDFVALEQNALASEECRRYWETHLAEAPFTRLPRLSGPAGEGADERGARVRRIEIPLEVSEGLKRLARSSALPLKSVLLAAHLKVMGLLGGHDSVLTGVVSNSRPEEADGDKLLGVFLNTVPLRVTLGEGSWAELARRTFEAERELLPFRRYPLAELQRRRGGEPLFETVFNFMNFHVFENVAKFDAVRVIEYTGHNELNYPLTANFSLSPNSYRVELLVDYHASVLSERQMEEVEGYYLRALAAMAGEPESPHAGSTLLSERERRQLLVEWNLTGAAAPDSSCVHELFERQARLTPSAVAVVGIGRQLTYAELDSCANRLARRLRRMGVGPDSLVGVCMGRSASLVVSLLAVLKAGGAYVPLDAQYPAERLAFMLEDAAPRVLLTEAALAEALADVLAGAAAAGGGPAVVKVDEEWDAIAAEGAGPVEGGASPDNLCYVIYTSGSTGRPKGVQVSHGAVVNYLHWSAAAYRVAEGEGVPFYSPVTFDLTVTSLLTPLSAGQRVVVLPESLGVESLAEAVRESSGLSLVKLTPSHLDMLGQSLPARDAANKVGAFVIGGEALLSETTSFWREHSPATRLINEYGPTEAAVGCCVYEVPAAGPETAAVPIGRPIANARLFVLDPHMSPLPVGVAGELYIGGAGLARGYLKRPALTAERFLPDPFSAEPGARLYRTGDVARYDSEGLLHYLGRTDEQVKVRGYRIELGEIEAALRRHPDVREAAVLAREDGGAGKRLVAYVVARAASEAGAGVLRDFLRGILPDYMVPQAFVALGELPVTPNGKVDRRRLPAPEVDREALKTEFVAPQTPAEEVVARVWKEVLRADEVGLHDHFFDLGGDSLLATQMVARLRETFRVELPLRGLYAEPTVAGVVSAVAEAWGSREVAEEVARAVQELEGLSEEQISAMISEVSPG